MIGWAAVIYIICLGGSIMVVPLLVAIGQQTVFISILIDACAHNVVVQGQRSSPRQGSKGYS